MTTVSRTLTIEQFAAYAAEHGRCELIRGEVHDLSPSGERHGDITNRLNFFISDFVYQKKLGKVYTAETGFRLDDDGAPTVRAPDISFIAASRTAAAANKSFCTIAPDLVVETLSPDDRVGEVSAKVRWWLAHGVRAVWVVDPEEQIVAVHAVNKQTLWLSVNDTLVGDDLLPGFTCKIADIFA
jgi:Uma2 family endonuclease